jgi:recombination protein RecR
MVSFLPKPVQNLIDEFSRLPGIGPKSAQRLAMHMLHSPENRIQELANALTGLKNGIQFCKNCWNIAEDEVCRVCADSRRNDGQICVVEEILDVVAIERTHEFKGVYHVLHGALSPVDGIGPEQLKIAPLMKRISDREEKEAEVILATNPGLEGDTTAFYIYKLLRPFENIHVTRIARGLPVGGNIDYADDMTLTRALIGRVNMD